MSYNYDRNHKPGFESSSSYDQGYSTQTREPYYNQNYNLPPSGPPRPYSHSVASDGFSDISIDPYNSRHSHNPQYYGYTNNVYSPDDPRRQVLDVQRMPLNDDGRRPRGSSTDSGLYGRRPPSIISSVGRDADVESIASHQTQSTVASYGDRSSVTSSAYDAYRYNGELFRPVAAPRRINNQTKKLFGEIHPRMLRPEEQAIPESGEETEDSMDSASIITPTAAPRASMRLSKSRHISFIEDEAIRQENLRLRSNLKRPHAPSRLSAAGSKLVVRFEHVDKKSDTRTRRDMTDYSDIDSDHGGKKKKKQKADVWSHVGPMSQKPDRNSMRRNSTKRSSSADRSRSSQRSSSGRKRSNSTSSTSRKSQPPPSVNRKDPLRESGRSRSHSHRGESKAETADDAQVSIKMPKGNSMMGDIRKSNAKEGGMFSDRQKICKWALIIGVPVVLIVIVIVVVAVVFSQQ